MAKLPWVHGRGLNTFYPRKACNSSRGRRMVNAWTKEALEHLYESTCCSTSSLTAAKSGIVLFFFAVYIVDWIVARGRSFYSAAVTWYKSDIPHLLGGYAPYNYILLLGVVYSRLSLFRLPEVRPPRYTGQLAWHGMLAIFLLHKTHPEVRPLAIPVTGAASAGCSQQGNFIRVLQPDMTFWVWFSK